MLTYIRSKFFVLNVHGALCNPYYTASDIQLTSSLGAEGRTSACMGEVVVYTCRVVGSGYLQWAVEPFHKIEEDPILFTLLHTSIGHTVYGENGLFNATFVSKKVESWNFGNLTSRLSILAHPSLHNKSIQCSDGILFASQSPRVVLKIGST